MAYNYDIFFKHYDSYFNIREATSFTSIMTLCRTDKRRDSLISEVLINLTPQQWISGELKTDAQQVEELWAIGVFTIFNMNPHPTDTKFPASIVDWYIFSDKWFGRTVRTLAVYVDSKGTCKLTWSGV